MQQDITQQIKSKIRSETTLIDFCKKNNFRPSTISDFLNGKYDVRFSTFKKIANAAGFTITIEIATTKS